MNPTLLKQSLSFLLYWLAQVILFRNLAIFDTAFCFVYVGFLLLLPLEISLTALLLLGFSMGIAVDIFYDTAGVHAATMVLIAYVRPFILQILRPSGGYENVETPSIEKLGFNWFIIYVGISLFFHHFVLFAIQSSSFSLWLSHLDSIFTSAIVGTFMLTVAQYLFYRR